jgi:hypothetical protein
MNTGPELATVEKALELHEKGWSYRRIAKRLEVSVGTAFNYVHAAYDEYPEVGAKRDSLRQMELCRIDRVIRRLDKALRSTDDEVAVKAGTALVKASESRRKLLGLDAPTKHQEVPADEVAKMSAEEKLAAHEAEAARLREQIANGDGKAVH